MFCKQTSSTLAPELICNLPISDAWSKSSFSISLLNLFEPKTLVLSPTNIGLVDSSTYNDSSPVTKCFELKFELFLFKSKPDLYFCTNVFNFDICSGTVPQQPPTTFTHPFFIYSSIVFENSVGVSL